MKVLENCSWLESPWISVLTLSNPDPEVPNMKDLQDKIAHAVVELKKTYTQGPFLHRMKSLENGKRVLESPWKVLEFLAQKRVGTLNSKIFGKEPQGNETSLKWTNFARPLALPNIEVPLYMINLYLNEVIFLNQSFLAECSIVISVCFTTHWKNLWTNFNRLEQFS